MFYNALVTLNLLGAALTLGTKSPLSNQANLTPSPHDGRIVGGELANIEDYPYMAGYHWTSKEGYAGFCDGAIVTDQFVVTAAHCIDEIEDPSILTLRVGSSNRKEGKVIQILEIIIHPYYLEDHVVDLKHVNYDVAMLKTERLEFSDKVQPIELPKPRFGDPDYITVTGWGIRHGGGTKPTHLRRVELKTLDYTWCKTIFYNILTREMFCAGGYMKGICAGDDGAPAVQKGSQNHTVLAGITLFQRGCASGLNPAAFIKVSAPPILYFITKTIND